MKHQTGCFQKSSNSIWIESITRASTEPLVDRVTSDTPFIRVDGKGETGRSARSLVFSCGVPWGVENLHFNV